METWQCPGGAVQLGRYPYDGEERGLRAWNGADMLLAEYMTNFVGAPGNLLILNDQFGALAVAAARSEWRIRSQSDSWLARFAAQENLERNGLAAAPVEFVDSLGPIGDADWTPDLVLLQLPKSNLMLEFQLAQLSAGLPLGTPICAGGMTRDVHNSAILLFENYIGTTHTSLASHKARLIHSQVQAKRAGGRAPKNRAWPRTSVLQEPGLPRLELASHAGVFSASGHDQGSLLLLRYLADIGPGLLPPVNLAINAGPRIVDCGCGNGLLALGAAGLFPQVTLICADESFMAVESAREGFIRNGIKDRASFFWTDCLSGIAARSVDLVLCNPPFHQGQSQTLAISQRMFQQAAGCLKTTGTLVVVANKHLGHHRSLERWFGRVSIEAEDNRFLVITAKFPAA